MEHLGSHGIPEEMVHGRLHRRLEIHRVQGPDRKQHGRCDVGHRDRWPEQARRRDGVRDRRGRSLWHPPRRRHTGHRRRAFRRSPHRPGMAVDGIMHHPRGQGHLLGEHDDEKHPQHRLARREHTGDRQGFPGCIRQRVDDDHALRLRRARQFRPASDDGRPQLSSDLRHRHRGHPPSCSRAGAP